LTAAVAAVTAGLVAIGCGGEQEQAESPATTTVIATEAPAADDLGASSASQDPGRESKADDRTRSKTRAEDGTGIPAAHARDAGVESGGGNSSSASAGETSSAQGDSIEDGGTPTHVSSHGAPPGPSGPAVQPGGGDSDADAHPPSAPASAAAADGGEEQAEASAPPQP